MPQRTETLPVEIDHPAFMIMPGINPMAVYSVAENRFHDSSHHYSYDIQPIQRLRMTSPVSVSATIEQANSEPPYIVRDMVLKTASNERGLFGRVAIRHNLRQTETGFTPEAGQVGYFDYKTQTNYFLFGGSLVKEDSAGNRQLVGDEARFGGGGISVAIDASGIAVTILDEAFADITFDQSHVRMAVANIDHGVYTYSKELYFC